MEEKNLQVFENKYMEQFKELANTIKLKKDLEKSEKKLKEEIQKAMNEYGVKLIKTPYLKITSIGETQSVTIDLATFKNFEPNEYEQLLKDYPKTTIKAGYVKFEVV